MKKSIVFTVVVALLVLLALTILGTLMLYQVIESFSEERMVNSSENMINKALQNVDISLQDIEQMTTSIVMDPYITSYFTQPMEEGTFEWVQRENDLRGRIHNYYISSRSMIFDISLVKLDGTVISGNSHSELGNVLESEWYKEGVAQKKPLVITSPHPYPQYVGDETSQSIAMIREYSLYGGHGNSIGYIVVNMDYTLITNKLDDFKLSEDEQVLLLDDAREVIYSTSGDRYDATLINGLDDTLTEGTGHEIVQKDHVKNIVAHGVSNYTDWMLISIAPIMDSLIIGWYIAFFICFYIAAIGIISYLIITQILRPIISVKDAMLEVERGNLDIDVRAKGGSEIAILAEGFNSMVLEISNLIERIIQEEDEKKHIQLKVLQSQINPHFLYNTLNTIRILADTYGADDIMTVAASLIDLLRISISNPNEFIPIQNEIQYVKSYVNIQTYRYGSGIEVCFQVSDRVDEYMVPKLILQPIVENALFHGIEPKAYVGKIEVTAQEVGRDVEIKVEDDGVGIAPDALDALCKELQSPEDKSDGEHIGLKNVNKRLRLHFGEAYGVTLHSKVNKGTCVCLKFPKIK